MDIPSAVFVSSHTSATVHLQITTKPKKQKINYIFVINMLKTEKVEKDNKIHLSTLYLYFSYLYLYI